MKKLAIIAALLASFGAHAEEGWIPLAISADKTTQWDAKSESGLILGKKSEVFTVLVRIQNRDFTAYRVAMVSTQDCLNGYGVIKNFTLQGDASHVTDFVLTGTTVGDILAGHFCAAAASAQERNL